jgi:glycosyltransferase involved in cell wall biosynthesis
MSLQVNPKRQSERDEKANLEERRVPENAALQAQIALLISKIHQLNREAESVNRLLIEAEVRFADLQTRLREKDGTIREVRDAKDKIIQELQFYLSRYKRVKETLLPTGSLRDRICRNVAGRFLPKTQAPDLPSASATETSPATMIAGSGLFDKDWYLSENPDVGEAGVDPVEHYLSWGGFEGRDPSPLFDSDQYLLQNPDVAKSGVNPLLHYVRWGKDEGRTATIPKNSEGGLSVEAAVTQQGSRPEPEALVRGQRFRVVFISGELPAPGHQDRIFYMAQSLAPRFFETIVIRIEELPQRVVEIAGADIVWIGRTALLWSDYIPTVLETVRRERSKLVCDVDDFIPPDPATTEITAGSHSQEPGAGGVHGFHKRIHAGLAEAAHCTTPTVRLASEIRDLQKPTTVIPNGFDRRMVDKARGARWARRAKPEDGLIRIGYAAGSPIPQRDWAVVSRAVAAVLAENPNARMVLFKGAINLTDFPELREFVAQIEWREQVTIDERPSEYARFDISLAPREFEKWFCGATSQPAFFEAALVGVAVVASPTEPFTDLIRHNETGFLADSEDEWSNCLRTLIRDRELRECMAERLYSEALWLYGPERRNLLMTRLVNRLLAPPPLSSELFPLDMVTGPAESLPRADLAEYDVLYQSSRRGVSRVSVVIPLFNYVQYVQEALDSVRQQTIHDLDVIVVDDRSTDDSVAVARTWLRNCAGDFNMVALLQNRRNSNLARTRNTAVSFCGTELFFPLDPDNVLLPDCIEKCLALLDDTGAAFTYPTIVWFGEKTGKAEAHDYDPALFQSGNYIDAMALVRKACWVAVGGYTRLTIPGWEDYEFWCKLAEKGFFGARVPDVTAKYRVHATSMINSVTGLPENKSQVIRELNSLHPWLGLRSPGSSDAGESVEAAKGSPIRVVND